MPRKGLLGRPLSPSKTGRRAWLVGRAELPQALMCACLMLGAGIGREWLRPVFRGGNWSGSWLGHSFRVWLPTPPLDSLIVQEARFLHLWHPGVQLVHAWFAATQSHYLSLFLEQVPYLVHSQHGIGSVCSWRRRLRRRGFAEISSSSSLGRTVLLADRACTPLCMALCTNSSVELRKSVRDGIVFRIVIDGINDDASAASSTAEALQLGS